ncbi:hypothetical protein KV692_05305 [Xanthomonas euvesicatoria pv. physalidis]|uniref:hypothetical protein n=1 Tax=Xanthomonas euvesicatoria TaxID=456327 RepID=UPI001C47282D|nr:hypothetical protein [Xanthomonas euvesicatoria]MBV6687309.1 hypothetical protein [Xanthomonas euvesicatoria pv. physalidis]MBV6794269.1 hypothetical protein [Xanthomonas campestris pv. daturae]
MRETAALKAYQVDHYDQSVVIFDTSSVAARRRGAGEMDCEFSQVESCRRTPALDAYAPGPVPPLVLIDNGWWFECGHCGCRIDDESIEDDGLQPKEVGQAVFCSRSCWAEFAAQRRLREAAIAAICELVQTQFPQAEIIRAHVCDHRLEKGDRHGGILSSCDFRLPGLQHVQSYRFREGYFIANGDIARFDALYGAGAKEARHA